MMDGFHPLAPFYAGLALASGVFVVYYLILDACLVHGGSGGPAGLKVLPGRTCHRKL